MDITVKNSGTVPRKDVREATRGNLFVIEDAGAPFPIRRVYVISGVEDPTITRGGHAHHATDQAIFVLKGSLTLHLDDGTSKQSIELTSKEDGVRLKPLLWHSMSDFTADCVALVVASLPYDEKDYIREYERFKTYVST